MRLGRGVDALAQLQRRLLRGRPVAAGARDHEAAVLRDRQALAGELLRDRVREPADVLAAQRRQRRDGARVGGRVAVALLDLGRRDHDLVAEGCDRPLRLGGHEPLRSREGARGLERQRRLALVADEHEHVGVGRREHGLERVDAVAARLRGVEGGAAADGGDAAFRQPQAGRHLGQPLRLRRDRLPHLLARHGCLYTMAGDGGLRAPLAVERPTGADRADAARAVGLLLRHARGRLALRDRGDERDRALRRAHVLQGDRAAADGARHRRRDRRDRRRVQRLHRQGVHGLLRPLRRRDTRHRARRPRRHAPQLPASTPRRSSARRA